MKTYNITFDGGQIANNLTADEVLTYPNVESTVEMQTFAVNGLPNWTVTATNAKEARLIAEAQSTRTVTHLMPL